MKQELLARLAPWNQEHLLAFWDELDAAQRARLADEIRAIDMERLAQLYRHQGSPEDWAALARQAEPPRAFRQDEEADSFSHEQARDRGLVALKDGHVGVILVAGGQGSRLGFHHPKGMFPIGPISQSTLFQILCEKIVSRSRACGAAIPLYLMTSPATHDETVEFLAAHDNFGLPKTDVKMFSQGTMPAVDAGTGRVLLAGRDHVALSPDGHGGTVEALAKHGLLDEIRGRGVRQLFYCQVDNPLIVMCDPVLLGFHLFAGSELSTQVIRKRTSREKLGNVVSIDGQLRIIEYSDLNPLPDEIVERRAADGSPVFWAGNTAAHVFDVEFLARAAAKAGGLAFHVARKIVPYVDGSGRKVHPDRPNAIKFERFIFDLMPEASLAIVVEADEATTFAPVKNALGESCDTPATVQAQMIALHRQWLEDAGCRVAPGVTVEISPLFAQEVAELPGKTEPGTNVTQPRYFC